MVFESCCGEEKYDEQDGVKIALKKYEDRRSTDVIWFLGIIACWVIMTIVGALSMADGNPWRLIAPVSADGNVCGIDPGVANRPKLYYVMQTGLGQCQADCPTVDEPITSTTYSDYICLSWVDQYYIDQGVNGATNFASYITGNCQDSNGDYDPSKLCSCNIKRASKSVFNRCVYTNAAVSTPNENPTASDYLKMFASDIITARNVVFGFGFCIALLSAFAFTYLMSINCLASILSWGCIGGVLCLGIAIASYGASLQKKWEDEDPQAHSDTQISLLVCFNYFMMSISIIYFLVMLYLCSSINMAVKCVSMGAKALDEMPLMVCMPIVQIAALILFMIPFFYYLLYIASDGYYDITYADVYLAGSGTPVQVAVGRTWNADHDDRVGLKMWYLFFCFLWTMNFISNFGSMVISHAVATWYFTKPEDRVEAISSWNVVDSYKLVSRFHLGTLAFGSLLIALVQFARAIAMYIQRNTSEEFRSKLWVKIVFCCINCCLCCLECVMKFISKNAYIQTAIRGTGFCTSAGSAFSLIATNLGRIGAIVVASSLALFIGKVFVTALATSLSYIYISDYFTKDLYDPVGPTVMVMVISWMTASMFMDVLHMSIDTIFYCFLHDETANGGVAAFAGDDLGSFVNDHGKMELSETQNPAKE